MPAAATAAQPGGLSRARRRDLIDHFCSRDSLKTFDPYDVWKTRAGVLVKTVYNRRRAVAAAPAGILALWDTFLNNRRRLLYSPQEYPAARAFASLILLNICRHSPDSGLLEYALKHLNWLAAHQCAGYSGACWGLGIDWPVQRGLRYGPGTPLSTATPYALEAFVEYGRVTRDARFDALIRSTYNFLEDDLHLFDLGEGRAALSYGPGPDRIVTNASSYGMLMYALVGPYLPHREAERARGRIRDLYSFVRSEQCADGSWLYAPAAGSFIDCFHSCIILKNLIKTSRIVPLDNCDAVVRTGYGYVKRALFDPAWRLMKRFSLRNKPGLVRFDLYDNAEMLNLALLVGDEPFARTLLGSILDAFCDGRDVYSAIDAFGVRRNRNMLRWAVMPFLFALSQIPDSLLE